MYITVAEAAAALGVNESTVRRALVTNRLRGRKFAGVWQVERASIGEFERSPAGRKAKVKNVNSSDSA